MENQNSPEYLEKIKIQVIENLKKTTFAPSVQMQDVPRNSMMGDLDEEDDRLNDADEDENMDTRHTQHRSDKHIERADELDESDDEEGNRNLGLHSNGTHKRRNHANHQNIPQDDEMDVDSGVPSPNAQPEVEDAIPTITATNAQVNDEVMENKQLEAIRMAGETGISNAASRADSVKAPRDNEDVQMNDAEAVQSAIEPQTSIDTMTVPIPAVSAAEVASHVATPPDSPDNAPVTVPAVETAAATDATQAITETVAEALAGSPEPMLTTSTQPVATPVSTYREAQKDGEAEREAENIAAEAATEAARS